MKIKAVLFFLCIHLLSFAQNVTITGVAKDYKNKDISLWIARDFISESERRVTFSSVDFFGNFVLEFEVDQTQYVTLKIENSIASMFVEPGEKYEVVFGLRDTTTYLNPNIEYDVELQIKIKSKTEINALAIDYDNRFDKFLDLEYIAFVQRSSAPKLDTFKRQITAFYADVNNEYFQNYVKYSIATMEEKVKVSRNKLFSSYIDSTKILFGHKEYFHFFNAFYKQYLRNKIIELGDTLKNQIDVKMSFSGTVELLKGGKYLPNDTILELVLIRGLYECYYDRTLKKEAIIEVLRDITDESNIEECRTIAQNVLNTFSKLKPGEVAPYFELPDKGGEMYSINELHKEKAVYFFFFDQNSTACLQQIKLVADLQKKYWKHILFVGISVDVDKDEFLQFFTEYPSFDWLILQCKDCERLMKDYEVYSLPAYYLIDTDGKFIQAPAEGLEGDFERVFYEVTKPKGKVHQVGDKTNE